MDPVTPSKKPRVILGVMTFGPPGTEAKGARVTSLDEYNQCLDYIQKSGYSEIDTARAYIGGEQEAWTREAGWKQRNLSVSTKVWPVFPGMHNKANIEATLNKSLAEREIGATWEKVPYPEDVVQALDQAWLINKGTAPRYWHQTPPKG
jgi:aflatoxin B1 aldehyde reductase